ncbi:MAG: hypothetical protein ACI9BF_000616 [Candidatus Paceibacteria bacterium]|jgi:hypothetical protein
MKALSFINIKHVLLAILMFCVALTTFSFSASQTQAQVEPASIEKQELLSIIDDLIAQIAILQKQVQTKEGDSSYAENDAGKCIQLTRSLYLGVKDATSNGEVTKLQKFLIDTGDYTFVRSSGRVESTGYYGPATAAAVSRFQVKYRSEILSLAGVVNPTGYFGASTRAKVNALYGCDTSDNNARTSVRAKMGSTNGTMTIAPGDSNGPVVDFGIYAEGGDGYVNEVSFLFTGGQNNDEEKPWDVFSNAALYLDGDKFTFDMSDDDYWTVSSISRNQYIFSPFKKGENNKRYGLHLKNDHSYSGEIRLGVQRFVDGSSKDTWDVSFAPGGIKVWQARTGNSVAKTSGATRIVISDQSNVSEHVYIISPDGGETFDVDDEMSIQWSSGGMDTLSIALYENNKWVYWIAKDIIASEGKDQMTWDIPDKIEDIIGSGENLRIYITGHLTNGGYHDDKSGEFSIAYKENESLIENLNIENVKPKGGEFELGDEVKLSWKIDDLPRGNYITCVTIQSYSDRTYIFNPTSGDATCWTAEDRNYSYVWESDYKKGLENYGPGKYRVRVLVMNKDTEIEQYEYGNWFRITGEIHGEGITVTAPNGGEEWRVGGIHTITWKPYDYNPDINPSTDVTAYLQEKVRGKYLTVGKILENGKASIHTHLEIDRGGNYAKPGKYYVKIVNNETGDWDRSDRSFTILKSVNDEDITVTAPNGGEVWNTGQTNSITWKPYDYGPDVNPSNDVTAYLDKKVGGKYVEVGKILDNGKASIHTHLEIDKRGNYAESGEYYVRVINNKTGATDRSDRAFTVKNSDYPEITDVYPAKVSLGEKTTVTLYGSKFDDTLKVSVTGPGVDTTVDEGLVSVYSNGTKLEFEFPKNIDKAGVYSIGVYNYGVGTYSLIRVEAVGSGMDQAEAFLSQAQSVLLQADNKLDEFEEEGGKSNEAEDRFGSAANFLQKGNSSFDAGEYQDAIDFAKDSIDESLMVLAILESLGVSSITVDFADQDTSRTVVDGAQAHATFEIEVDVTAVDEDVYIANSPDTSMGWQIEDRSGEVLNGEMKVNLSSSADDLGRYYEIQEGETETMTLTVQFTPEDRSVAARLVLKSIHFNDTESSPNQSIELSNSDFRTDTVFIMASADDVNEYLTTLNEIQNTLNLLSATTQNK